MLIDTPVILQMLVQTAHLDKEVHTSSAVPSAAQHRLHGGFGAGLADPGAGTEM